MKIKISQCNCAGNCSLKPHHRREWKILSITDDGRHYYYHMEGWEASMRFAGRLFKTYASSIYGK